MRGKSVEAHSRVMLMHECTVREFSTLLMKKIIDIVGTAREKSGHPAAEKKAEELRKIIEHSKTEERDIKKRAHPGSGMRTGPFRYCLRRN